MSDILIARIGEVPAGERRRILVDRLWPRGVRREDASWDEWLKDVAPSAELRRWYGHEPARYPEFRRRYRRELTERLGGPALQALVDVVRTKPVALLTATHELGASQVPVLAAFLRETLGEAPADADHCPPS